MQFFINMSTAHMACDGLNCALSRPGTFTHDACDAHLDTALACLLTPILSKVDDLPMDISIQNMSMPNRSHQPEQA